MWGHETGLCRAASDSALQRGQVVDAAGARCERVRGSERRAGKLGRGRIAARAVCILPAES
jgi:hypothetical protein